VVARQRCGTSSNSLASNTNPTRQIRFRQRDNERFPVPEYSWRPSGLDGRQHAFTAHGGYIPTDTHTAYVRVSSLLASDAAFAAHTVELYVAACAHEVPSAFMLPTPDIGTADVPRCTDCLQRTGVLTPHLRLASVIAKRAVAYRPGARS
jgi:hypothetical protein